MLCEKCKKNTATVFYEETINGKTVSYSLCGDCAAEMEKEGKVNLHMDFPDPFAGWMGGSLFQSLFGPVTGFSSSLPEAKRCSLCGATLRDLSSDGKMGCPKCYETFGEELEDSVRRIHGTSSHTGRAPARLKDRFDRKRKIGSLEKELREAVKDEAFERAASLRDELKALRDAESAGDSEEHGRTA